MSIKIPIGTILPFAGDVTNTAISDPLNKQGFLPCIGLSLATSGPYASLFQLIGYSFGGGGGFFNVPDLRGLFVIGPVSPRVVGSLSRSTTGKPVSGFLSSTDGNHNHTLNYVPTDHFNSDYCAGHDNAAWNGSNVNLSQAGSHVHSVTSGGDAESRPINVALDYIIKFADI